MSNLRSATSTSSPGESAARTERVRCASPPVTRSIAASAATASAGTSSAITTARRLIPSGSDASTAAAAPAPSVITPPTSAPSRPAPMKIAATAQMSANRGVGRGARLPRTRKAPAPSSTITARIASSSFPIPKKRAPKPGFGPASERTISGEPATRSTA